MGMLFGPVYCDYEVVFFFSTPVLFFLVFILCNLLLVALNRYITAAARTVAVNSSYRRAKHFEKLKSSIRRRRRRQRERQRQKKYEEHEINHTKSKYLESSWLLYREVFSNMLPVCGMVDAFACQPHMWDRDRNWICVCLLYKYVHMTWMCLAYALFDLN